MVINYAELGTHGCDMLWEACLVGGSVYILNDIYQLGVKEFTASLVRRPVGVTSKFELVYLVIAWEISSIADTIFYQLGWGEEISRTLAGAVVGGISSVALLIVARQNAGVAYLITALTVLQLALWTLVGVILMKESAKGMIKACSDTDPVV